MDSSCARSCTERIAGIFWRIAVINFVRNSGMRLSSAVAEVAQVFGTKFDIMAYRSMNACCCCWYAR